MKKITILLRVLLIGLVYPALFTNCNADTTKIDNQNNKVKHGKNGKDGKCGEDGEDGEDGQNGGNGGRGGNGGPGVLRGGNGGNGGNAVDSSVNSTSEQANQNVDEMEYSILKEMCKQVISTSISKFYNPLNDECLSHCKKIILTYLIHIGTPAARKLWQEYESIKWSYPAILTMFQNF